MNLIRRLDPKMRNHGSIFYAGIGMLIAATILGAMGDQAMAQSASAGGYNGAPIGDGETPPSVAPAVSGQINANTGRQTGFSPLVIASPSDDSRNVAEPGGDGRVAERKETRLAPNEFETFVFRTIGHYLPRFGSSLLIESTNGFAPPNTATVPPGYTLNPGDELVIGVTGSIEASNLHATVDSEGRIFIPQIGSIQVGGVRYGELAALLRSRVGRDYRDFKLSVAVGRLHGIRVYITGYVAHPGSYTVNSLSTLVNGVLAGGGPASGGSFRFIELRRGGSLIAMLDLYDLLLKGDKANDVVLENEDVIYVEPVGSELAVTGSVNAEAIYEMKPRETLRDVLAFAGGANSVADKQRVLLQRPSTADAIGWEQLTMSEAVAAPTERGEIVRVLSAVDLTGPIERQSVLASIAGEVAHPGHYYMPPGSTLGDLIARAGGTMPSAFPFASQFLRTRIATQQKANFERTIADLQFSAAARPLTAQREDADVGLQMAAFSNIIQQLAARKPDGRLVLNVRPDSATLPASLVLENNDQLLIPTRPVSVGVAGAVKQPGDFLFTSGLSLQEYLDRAGGLQRIADRGEVFVVRADGSVISDTDDGWFDSSILSEPALPGDLIVVPMRNAPARFWTIVKDVTQTLYQTAIGVAGIGYLTK